MNELKNLVIESEDSNGYCGTSRQCKAISNLTIITSAKLLSRNRNITNLEQDKKINLSKSKKQKKCPGGA